MQQSSAILCDGCGQPAGPGHIARRLKRLESEGYIDYYRAVLSRKATGIGVVAFVQVRFAVHDVAVSSRFEREIQAMPRIISCHNVSGSADYFLEVVARDISDYGMFMTDVLRSLPGVTSVESMLSLRAHALITGGLFAALIVLGWVANLLDALDLIPPRPGIRLASLVVFLGLAAALGFSAIPLMVGAVLGFQRTIGNENVPATGFSIGISRLMAALSHLGKAGEPPRGPVVVTVFDRERISDYQKMVASLRNAGIRAELYLGSGKMGAQLKYADKRGAPCVVIQGGDEKARGEVQIKDLIEGAKAAAAISSREEWREGRPAQIAVHESKLIDAVREILDRHAIRRDYDSP